MKKLDKWENTTTLNFDPKEGERTLLSSNKGGMRSPSLDYLDTSAETVTEDMALDYLAQIISDIFIERLYAKKGSEESSDILPGFNKGTG